MIEEELPEVPDLIVPKWHRPASPREFDGESLVLLDPSDKGWLTVTLNSGTTFKLGREVDILKLFPQKYNWTFSRFREWDCIFKVLTKYQTENLYRFNDTTIGDYKLFWIPGTGKMRLIKGNDAKSSKFLINIAPWILNEVNITNFEQLGDAVSKLIKLNQVFPVNFLSPASTVKDIILRGADPKYLSDGREIAENSNEFSLFNKLPMEDIRFLHSCYKGPRMESSILGSFNAGNQDMVKAYLNVLKKCPTTNPKKLLIKRGAKVKYEQAHPGSGYLVRVKVPRTMRDFPPIPIRTNGIHYPVGEFTTRLSRSYLDILEEVKDIEYEILDSIQLIVLEDAPPFEKLCTLLETFEETYKSSLYPLNLKRLHYTIVGHFLHYHPEYDRETGEITYVASQDYNPVLSNTLQGTVAKEVWMKAVTSNTRAIRVDALTGNGYEEDKRFKLQPEGSMTFLTPSLKDKPGKTTYRDLIYKDRDKPYVILNIPRRISFQQGYLRPSLIGKLKDSEIRISPTGGNRFLREEIKRVGNLLEGEIPLVIPDTEKLLAPIGQTPEIYAQGRDWLWVENYLALFPEIRI